MEIDEEEYRGLRRIAYAAYPYAEVFYSGAEDRSPQMQSSRQKLMRALDIDWELVEKFNTRLE